MTVPDDDLGFDPPPHSPDPRPRGVRTWLVVLLVAVVSTAVLAVLGAPSPVLFGALLGGLLVGISRMATPELPRPVSVFGQALLGVSTGAVIDPETLGDFVDHAGPVVLSVLLTIAASILLGQLLRLQRKHRVTPATATFSFIAGGASGVTAVADELGADDRVVAVVQYLRVLIILVGMPVMAVVAFGAPVGSDTQSVAESTGLLFGEITWPALGFTVICLLLGLLLARIVSVPAGNLLLPLSVAAVFAVTGALDPLLGPGATEFPAPLEAVAFAIIGLQVGLRFTRESLRSVARLLPMSTAIILVIIAVSAGIGIVLADVIGISRLDGYLATTPGGLYAVLLTADLAGGDVTFVLAVQVLRLFLVLALAPVIAAYYRRRKA